VAFINTHINKLKTPKLLTLRMQKDYSKEELMYKAASYCSLSEHCISEVEEKLNKWGASESDKSSIIDGLIDEKFIDETRFSNSFVKDKFRFNKWGKTKIAFAIKVKGIDRFTIAEALDTIHDEEYLELLTELLKSKLTKIKYESEYEKQGKLFKFGLSRGFESKFITKALQALKIETSDIEDFELE